MKKKTINAFTLVEMLIVIVIIGILIAALLPRMQAAQGRARDISRKTALSQIQTAIVTHQGDKGSWPQLNSARSGMACNDSGLVHDLQVAGMNQVPEDPISTNENKGLTESGSAGQYTYLVAKRNGAQDGGFVLMAHTEVEGSSNRIVCDSGSSAGSGKGWITNSMDISSIHPCDEFVYSGSNNANGCSITTSGNKTTCTYTQESQLRYMITY